jgi:RNA polymerase sigma-70 factor (ECF subfamily)
VPNDPDAKRAQFEVTALPFMKALYNAALRLTGGASAAASDLVQETYLRAYRTFENFIPGTNCKAWLFTILYSVFVNQRKKERRTAFSLPTEELEQRYHEAAATSGELVTDTAPPMPDERWGPEVDRALRVLPATLRAAVLLVDIEQLSYEEAATALGWPIGTLRSRLFRARKQLFAALQAYAQEVGYLKNAAGGAT